MHRALGMLTGTLLAIGLVVAIVGLPGFHRLADEHAAPAPRPASTAPVAPGRPIAATLAEPESESASKDTVDDPAPAPGPSPALPASGELPAAPPAAEPGSVPAPLRWHAFWSPFRSRVAANGFVAQLARVTGLDYRVVSLGPGVYEVAFAYSDESEIESGLAAIRAATGMEIGGS